jgi:exopolyphosphatase / guanosine-5'-triphosphate,3'-diphosphate pyrophosphatase
MENGIAIIDLGTNTFHLMIAKKTGSSYKIIHRERAAVKLGMGGINDGIILAGAITRALTTLTRFKSILDEHSIKNIYAFGTSALRNAANAKEITETILQQTGIKIDIISGEQEARYIYEGVNIALGFDFEPNLIIDIGAGSVELIIGNKESIFWKKSLEIGAQRLIEKFRLNDPMTEENTQALNDYFNQSFTELLENLKKYNPGTLAGSSGTFDTLSDIYCAQQGINKGEFDAETPFSKDSFEPIFKELLNKNREERMRMPGMIDLRVDMIVVGCCLVNYILNRHDFTAIRVSSYSLKEGALAVLTNNRVGHI